MFALKHCATVQLNVSVFLSVPRPQCAVRICRANFWPHHASFTDCLFPSCGAGYSLGNLRVTCPLAQVVLLRARRVVATISLTLRYAS